MTLYGTQHAAFVGQDASELDAQAARYQAQVEAELAAYCASPDGIEKAWSDCCGSHTAQLRPGWAPKRQRCEPSALVLTFRVTRSAGRVDVAFDVTSEP